MDGFRPDTFSMFKANYLNMAISGTELATEFEIATKGIFEQLDFRATHVGNIPLNPDVFAESPLNYSGVIDTKVYRNYSITNDHRNRMINNYIPTYQSRYGNVQFFMYVGDGFGSNIDSQIQNIAQRTEVNGCVITARNLIRLLKPMIKSPI